MPSRALANLIVALLHEVAGPHHSRRGGRRHRRSAVAPASPPPLSTLAAPHRRVLERPPSPSPDRPMNQVTPVHDPSSSIHQGRRREEKKTMSARSRWSPAPLGCRRYVRRQGSPSVHGADPKDRWHQGPPPRRQPRRPLPSPRQDRSLPSSAAGPSGSDTPPDLKSPCSNRLLRRFTHHATQSDKGRAPGSWDSTAGPSR
jgi:hypothetical protein